MLYIFKLNLPWCSTQEGKVFRTTGLVSFALRIDSRLKLSTVEGNTTSEREGPSNKFEMKFEGLSKCIIEKVAKGSSQNKKTSKRESSLLVDFSSKREKLRYF